MRTNGFGATLMNGNYVNIVSDEDKVWTSIGNRHGKIGKYRMMAMIAVMANGSDLNPFRTKLVFIRTKKLPKQFAE